MSLRPAKAALGPGAVTHTPHCLASPSKGVGERAPRVKSTTQQVHCGTAAGTQHQILGSSARRITVVAFTAAWLHVAHSRPLTPTSPSLRTALLSGASQDPASAWQVERALQWKGQERSRGTHSSVCFAPTKTSQEPPRWALNERAEKASLTGPYGSAGDSLGLELPCLLGHPGPSSRWFLSLGERKAGGPDGAPTAGNPQLPASCKMTCFWSRGC